MKRAGQVHLEWNSIMSYSIMEFDYVHLEWKSITDVLMIVEILQKKDHKNWRVSALGSLLLTYKSTVFLLNLNEL